MKPKRLGATCSSGIYKTTTIGKTVFDGRIRNGIGSDPGLTLLANSQGVILLDPVGDYDGDGTNNTSEDVAGTNPLDSTSLLRILSLSNGNLLTWSSVPTRTIGFSLPQIFSEHSFPSAA